MFIVAIIVLLLLITYEDMKFRSVRIVFFPLLTGLLVYHTVGKFSSTIVITNLIINVGYILLIVFISFGYLWIKYGAIKNIFKNYLGLGDLFFFIAMACWFNPFDFMIFNVLSFIVALTFHFVHQYVFKNLRNKETIPLAGIQSLCFLFVFVAQLIFNINSFV